MPALCEADVSNALVLQKNAVFAKIHGTGKHDDLFEAKALLDVLSPLWRFRTKSTATKSACAAPARTPASGLRPKTT